MLLLLAFALFCSGSAYAYPHFVGYGYTSCRACHFNPLGNGPLTDYGRALGANTISGRPPFLSKNVTDEDLANYSGVFGKSDLLPNWFRLAGGYRGMWLDTGLETSQKTRRFITMQAEGSLILKPSESLYGVLTLGYAPVPYALQRQNVKVSTLISREHYLAWMLSKRIGLYGGMMDVAFGIRIPDHTAYSRTKTRLAQNDQTHGALFFWEEKTWSLGVHAIFGNYTQDASIRQQGVSVVVEKDFAEKLRLGVSALGTQSLYRRRNMGAVHAKIGGGEGQALLMETGMIMEHVSPVIQTGNYFLTQGMTRLFRGFHVLMTLEYYTENAFSRSTRYWRYGPGLQWFPVQRIELRTDIQNTQATGGSVISPDSLQMLTQVHLWL